MKFKELVWIIVFVFSFFLNESDRGCRFLGLFRCFLEIDLEDIIWRDLVKG